MGRIKLELGQMEALLVTLENPNSTNDEKTSAKNQIKQCCLNIIKLENTIANKANYTLTLGSNTYTDQELSSMSCM